MKLKLFIASILVLLALIAYQKYSEYSALKSVGSYESCVAAKGSTIQESYPATCLTRIGTHFKQTILASPSPARITTTTNWLHAPELVSSSYVSSVAKLSLTFPTPVYVAEVFDSSDNINGVGYITLSKNQNIEGKGSPYMQISYGIPFIDGKGGACVDEHGNGVWISKVILNQKVDVCDQDHYFSSQYPQHPSGKIEYWFSIQNNNISSADYEFYKAIVYSAKFTN